jgi:hypothetical protein
LLQTFYSIIYVAAESVGAGKLAPLDAPGLALRTFLRGAGAPMPAASAEAPMPAAGAEAPAPEANAEAAASGAGRQAKHA